MEAVEKETESKERGLTLLNMDNKIRCELKSCNKVLTEEMDIEYSAEIGAYFCCFEHATDFYLD